MSKVVFDGVGEQPELNRITAKKNYASSSQSHKMGATAMFNDILHHLAKEKYPELLNEVGGLVAVRQHPVYAFQKIPIEGTDQYTRKFIGLFTVGADKGDKNFFGFSDSEIKKTAIRLEGVDHIKGVGFNYPWEVNGAKKIRYNAAKEALCIVTGSDPAKWIAIFEQSMAGIAETEAEIDAYLAEKWQPAFECAYYNNPLIVGVDMTLAEINANIEAFGNLRRNDDRPYSMCEIWIDGEYDVYYLDKETNRYEKNGINILTDLGIAEDEIAGLTIDEKNALFIQKRVERFRAQANEYFNVTDSIYQLMFLFIILATDNFEKNMYPYLMALLWRFLQDDLDSIFSTDNQGLDTKKYSTELHDFTDDSKSAYVFKGEDSAFWQLIELAFPNECKQMGRDILQAMYDKASGGTTTTEKLLCFFDDYFFNRAQNYFTPSAYNDDTEYAYEEAWNNKEYVSSVDIHPLAQALGSHESTERAWLEKRIIYLQSKFSFGSFASSASDLGVISFRTQQAQSFTLTPAIDCYPTIVSGDGNVINAQQRVMAGESVTLEGAGGSNTNVYIVGADWLSDIGDLKGLALDPSAVQKLSISSKRLRRIKVGDEVASEVTSALQQLDIQRCDCLETIDARNLTSLVGVVDLSKCPRLSEAYFGGSSASAIVIAAGSKIEKLELPDSITNLSLVNLPNLTLATYEYEAELEYTHRYYATNQGVGNKCTYAVTNDTNVAGGLIINLDDVNSITVTGKGGSTPRLWCFVDANDVIISCAAAQASADNLSLTIPSYAVKCIVQFMASAYYRVVISKGAREGLSYSNLTALSYLRVENNPNIQGFALLKATFEDGAPLTNIRIIGFDYDGNSNDVQLLAKLASGGYFGINEDGSPNPNIIPVIEGTLNVTGSIYEDDGKVIEEKYGAGLILNVTGGYYVRFADPVVRNIVASKWGDGIGITLEQIQSIKDVGETFHGNTEIETFEELELFSGDPEVLENPHWNSDRAPFFGCKSLKKIKVSPAVTKIGIQTFSYTALEDFDFSNIEIIRGQAFFKSGLKGEVTIPKVKNIDNGTFGNCINLTKITFNALETIGVDNYSNINQVVFGGCVNLKEINFPNTLTTIKSPIATNTSLTKCHLPESLTTIGSRAFHECTLLSGEINLPNLEVLGNGSFTRTAITKIVNLGKITEILGDTNNNTETFNGCTSLTTVNFPESLTTIGAGAFSGCTSLEIEDLSLPNLETLKSYAFLNIKGIKKISNLGKITTIPAGNVDYTLKLWGDFDVLTEVTLPETLLTISNDSFKNYTSLTTVNFPESLTTIGARAFSGCTSLGYNETLLLQNVSGTIDVQAFYSTGYKNVIIRGNVEVLNGTSSNAGVFGNMPNLELIDLPSTLTYIGRYVFYLSKKLHTIICRAVVPPSVHFAFYNNDATNLKIYVPDGSVEQEVDNGDGTTSTIIKTIVELYKETSGWADYADKIYPLSVYEAGGAENLIQYDRLIGDGIAFLNLPIKVKAGYSYTFNIKVLRDSDLGGHLCSRGLTIYGDRSEIVVSANYGNGSSVRHWINKNSTSLGSITEITKIVFDNNGTHINDDIASFTNTDADVINSDREVSLQIFNGDYYGIMDDGIQLRSLEVHNSDGVMIHNFKPHKIGETVCLFDTIEKLLVFNSASNGQLSVENDVI